MNRDVKFRVWDNDYNEMLQVKAIVFDPKCLIPDGERMEPYILDEHNDIHYLSDIELLEYTSCKDGNGVEIYEGDIVKVIDKMPVEKYYGKEYICKIVYDKDRFIIENYYGSGTNRIAEEKFFNYKSIEVIGNIYENPKLLEVK